MKGKHKNKNKRNHSLNLPGQQDEKSVGTGNNSREQDGPSNIGPIVASEVRSSIQDGQHTSRYRAWLWRSLEASGIVAGVAYAVITYWSWRDLRQNFKLEQRPWVGVTDNRIIEFGDNSDYAIELDLSNSGKTPAFYSWYWNKSSVDLVPGPNQNNLDDGRKHVHTGSIPPQGNRRLRLIWKWNDKWGEAYPFVADGKRVVSNYGEIVYFDGNSVEHRTQFCVYLKEANLSDRRLTFCDRFNEMN